MIRFGPVETRMSSIAPEAAEREADYAAITQMWRFARLRQIKSGAEIVRQRGTVSLFEKGNSAEKRLKMGNNEKKMKRLPEMSCSFESQ